MTKRQRIEAPLESAAATLDTARRTERDAMQAARVAALDAIANGDSEVHVAQALGVNRMTVRKWLGKL